MILIYKNFTFKYILEHLLYISAADTQKVSTTAYITFVDTKLVINSSVITTSM